jgi:hypothetical protein
MAQKQQYEGKKHPKAPEFSYPADGMVQASDKIP